MIRVQQVGVEPEGLASHLNPSELDGQQEKAACIRIAFEPADAPRIGAPSGTSSFPLYITSPTILPASSEPTAQRSSNGVVSATVMRNCAGSGASSAAGGAGTAVAAPTEVGGGFPAASNGTTVSVGNRGNA